MTQPTKRRDPGVVRMDSNGRVRLAPHLHTDEWYLVRRQFGGVISLVPTGVKAPRRTRKTQEKESTGG